MFYMSIPHPQHVSRMQQCVCECNNALIYELEQLTRYRLTLKDRVVDGLYREVIFVVPTYCRECNHSLEQKQRERDCICSNIDTTAPTSLCLSSVGRWPCAILHF